MCKQFILFGFLFLSLSFAGKGQDAHYSQYFSDPVYLNPAFAGFEGCSRISTGCRDQWPSLSGDLITSGLSYDQYVKLIKGGVALRYQWDYESDGFLQTHSALFTYSPTFSFFGKRLFISPAIEAGWMGKYIDWNKAKFDDQGVQYDIIATPVPIKSYVGLLDLNAGMIFAHRAFVYGVAVHHVNNPKDNFYDNSRLPLRWTYHFSWVYTFKNDNIKLSPSFIFQKQQDFEEFVPSLSFYFHGVKLGTAFRMGFDYPDSFIGMVGYTCDWLTVGYSYDLTVSRLLKANGGSHEIMLQVKFNCINKSDKRKGIEQINF